MTKLKGDGDAADPALYKEPISIVEAEQLALRLLSALGIPANVEVVYGRKTRLRYGAILRLKKRGKEPAKFNIRLNSIGLNLGTLLHEMAHIGMDGKTISGHPPAFRQQLKILAQEYKKLLPIGTGSFG